MKTKELIITSIMVIVIIIIISLITINFTETPFGLYNDKSFWENVIVEAHGMILDLILVGVILMFFLSRIEKRREINELLNKIDFNRHIKTDEAKYTVFSIIQILNKKNITSLNLSQCNLSNLIMTKINLSNSSIHATNFYSSNLKHSNLSNVKGERTIFNSSNTNNVDFNNSNFYRIEFKSAKSKSSRFVGSSIIKSVFNNSDLNNSDFRNCKISNTSFDNAILDNADFRNCVFDKNVSFLGTSLKSANFENAKNIPVNNIIKAKCLKKCKFDNDIANELKKLDATINISSV